MRLLWMMLGLAAGCDPVADKGIRIVHTSPIGVGEIGFVRVTDECQGSQSGCRPDTVLVDSISSDDPGVLAPLPLATRTGEGQFMATGAGRATLLVTAHNGINDEQYELPIEVLRADSFVLDPVTLGVFRASSHPPESTLIPRSRVCAAPIRLQAESRAHFHLFMSAGGTELFGSGHHPFTSSALEVVAPPYGDAHDEDVVAFQVGTSAGPAAITSPEIPGSQLAIEVIPRAAATGLVLSDLQLIAFDTSGIWVDEIAGGQPICLDDDLRVARSETPDVCSIQDTRDAATRFRGPGPYRIFRSGADPCRITFEIPALGLIAMREY
ncbi:MAG TPA: hypothetical protein VNO30_29865 [Kofleriaceae bacterium]|nr:hypothetical protein [Kofleriaceae bacterium]